MCFSACHAQVRTDIESIDYLRKKITNELWSSGELDCPAFAVSLEYYPAFAISDSAFQTSKIGSSIESPFNLAATFSKVWTRRIFLGIGTGISNEGQINTFLDFKYSPSLRSTGPVFTIQAGSYIGIKEFEVIPYIGGGIGIRQRVFKWNFFDFHVHDQIRFNRVDRKYTNRNYIHYLLISFRFTWLIVQD